MVAVRSSLPGGRGHIRGYNERQRDIVVRQGSLAKSSGLAFSSIESPALPAVAAVATAPLNRVVLARMPISAVEYHLDRAGIRLEVGGAESTTVRAGIYGYNPAIRKFLLVPGSRADWTFLALAAAVTRYMNVDCFLPASIQHYIAASTTGTGLSTFVSARGGAMFESMPTYVGAPFPSELAWDIVTLVEASTVSIPAVVYVARGVRLP